MNMFTRDRLLLLINDDYGDGTKDPEALLESAVYDSVCPGICRICEATFEEVEPDTTTHWCEQCQENSVISCLVLAEII
jgi:formamidopyrimidine-DNA glycosylase